jgi:hypothetical protein
MIVGFDEQKDFLKRAALVENKDSIAVCIVAGRYFNLTTAAGRTAALEVIREENIRCRLKQLDYLVSQESDRRYPLTLAEACERINLRWKLVLIAVRNEWRRVTRCKEI